MKKIFVDGWALIDKKPSGISHTAYSIVSELAKRTAGNFELTLVIPRGSRSELVKWNLPPHVLIKEIPIFRRVFNRLNRYGLLPPVDLLLGKGDYIFPNFINWPLLSSNSYTYIHDIAFARHPESVEPRNQRMLATKVPRWIKRSTKVITVSDHAKQEIMDYYNVSEEKIDVVYNGVDTDHFKPATQNEIDQLKQKLGITGKYLLYFGNIEPRKNILKLVEAYKKLPKKIRDEFALVLVGGQGWLNEPIMEAIKVAQNEGYNILHPKIYVTDDMLPALYGGATALTHVAIYEGFGLSPLQALACNTPVLVSDNSSLPEVVGQAGLYCDANDSDDIAAKIEEIVKPEIAKKLLKQAPNQVAKFSWQNSVDQLLAAMNIDLS